MLIRTCYSFLVITIIFARNGREVLGIWFLMPQKELSCVEVLRFPRKFETVKPGVSAETARSHCTGIGKLVIEILPKGELETFSCF